MTILIKNIEILGGSRKFEAASDVFIKDGKISAIGHFPGKKADRVIEGMGSCLAPGFIDINATSDHHLSIFTAPDQSDFLAQGVTTIAGGQSGFSLAPFFKSLPMSLQYWTDASQINFNWRTVAEFLKTLSAKKIGVNFLTLTGYENLLASFGFETKNSVGKKDSAAMRELLQKTLTEGSFGLSVEEGSPVIPALPNILKELAAEAKKDDALISFHLDECRELKNKTKEILGLIKNKSSKIIFSHFMPLIGNEIDYEEAIKLLERDDRPNIYFDIFPLNDNLLPISHFLPSWVKKSQTIIPAKAISDPWFQNQIAKEIINFDPNEIKVTQAFKFDFLVGKTISELSEIFSLPATETLIKIMSLTKLKANLAVNNINFDLALKYINHPKALIASHSASMNEKSGFQKISSLRSRETFSRFLKYATETKSLSLNDAIKKITLLPAKILGIQNRGLIEENYWADLVIMKNQEIKTTIVNGQVAWEDGVVLGLPGKVLRHGF